MFEEGGCGKIVVEGVCVCCGCVRLRDVLQLHDVVVSCFVVCLFVCSFVRLFVRWRFIFFLRLYDMELVLQHVRAEIRGKYVCR